MLNVTVSISITEHEDETVNQCPSLSPVEEGELRSMNYNRNACSPFGLSNVAAFVLWWRSITTSTMCPKRQGFRFD